MIITYLGGQFFKVQFGDTTLAFNPISKDSKLKGSRFGADIALISADHEDFNGIDQVTHGDKQPFSITGPGEYEVGGVFIKGFLSETMYGGAKYINTVYTVTLEGMNLCFLGAINGDLSNQANEEIDEVDILFVPIGGEGVLEPAKAYKLAVSIEPKLIIPMHYGDVGTKDALKVFLKEAGASANTVDKLTIKKKDLEGKAADVVVLAPQS